MEKCGKRTKITKKNAQKIFTILFNGKGESKDMMVKVDAEKFGLLCVCAIRYCHGRETYMPSLVQGIVRQYLKQIDDRELHVMIADCDFQEWANLYGDERIDKPGWLKWKEDLLAEQKRRLGNEHTD